MTIEEIKTIAAREMESDGVLSKGVRVAILEHAKAGDTFTIEASLYDRNRISAELRRSSQAQRMRTKTAAQGKAYTLNFNTSK